MNTTFKTESGKYVCLLCDEFGIKSCFSTLTNLNKHCKIRHNTKSNEGLKNKTKHNDALVEVKSMISGLVTEIQDLKQKPAATHAPINNNNNNTTIYFNKDLKYYPELVKIMGREKACNYLLYGMPETKDIFGVIDKLFLQNGARGCPFRYDQDTGDFLIARAEGVFDRDPTGETIDRENKSKLQDAILSAYVDTTTQISRECADLRIARLNTEYTEADQEKLTRRFDALMTVEPIRPYEVIDLMNGLKPKKRDFDKIKKICPAIVKKITIS